MAKRAYHQIKDGEWLRPVHKGYRHICCDCHLVHIVSFRVRDGHVEMKLVRHRRATAAARRAFKFTPPADDE